jgi:hypothetical protein
MEANGEVFRYMVGAAVSEGIRRAIDTMLRNGMTEREVMEKLFSTDAIMRQAIDGKFRQKKPPPEETPPDE